MYNPEFDPTKLEMFAAIAMHGILANPSLVRPLITSSEIIETIATSSVVLAITLTKELEKHNEKKSS